MTIFFDYQIFDRQHIGGISRFYCEVIPYLRKDLECVIGVKRSNNAHLKEQDIVPKLKPLYSRNLGLLSSMNYPGKRTVNQLLNPKFTNYKYSLRLLRRQGFDVFEPTFFDSYFLEHLKGKPFTLEVHDMIPELFPEYFPAEDFQIVKKRLLCPLAAAIRVPSMRTKEDLVNILNIDPDKITVVHHGVPRIVVPSVEQKRPIEKPYILYVGDRWGYKNFNRALAELAIIVQTIPDIQLVCTGHGFHDHEKKQIADLHLTDNVRHLYATEENFYSLYHNAVSFVFPSAYEGFGLPILEAFACECPVMLNNASCFPEVGGDAALYFDINRRGDMAEQFISLYHTSAEDRNRLVSKGKERQTLFSWEKTARQMKQIYEKLV